MSGFSASFVAPLWRYQGDAAWFFVSLPIDLSDDVEAMTVESRRGFGSVRVEATVGGSTWRTSLFPDSKRGTYLLPLKKAVRAAEGLDEGDDVATTIRLID